MERKAIWIALVVIGFVLSGIAGFYVGSNAIAKSLLMSEVGTSVTSLNLYVKLSTLLKKHETEKAEELLESLTDIEVSSLGIQVQKKHFSQSRDEILAAIHKAKEYRGRWPNPKHKTNENLKNGVEAAFKL